MSINSDELFRKTKNLDFENTKDSPLYAEYWKGPDDLRKGGYEPTEETKNNKFWTLERVWQESGYNQKVRDSRSFFRGDEKFNDLSRKRTLVDLGSGKGQALLSFAIEWNFNKIIGVEINKDYLDISRENINNFSHQNPNYILPEIELLHMAAGNFEFSKDINFIFMFNPFGPKTCKQVCHNILESLDKYPRELYIFYETANHRSIFLETGRFKVIYEKVKYFILKST
tara:strand:- start:352 stop:1035 length:684 start_codon:yes stop_codon:yes gene_type:complete